MELDEDDDASTITNKAINVRCVTTRLMVSILDLLAMRMDIKCVQVGWSVIQLLTDISV